MEGSSAQLFVSSNEVTIHASKASACLGSDSVGVWNPGEMYKPLVDTGHKFWSGEGAIAPTHITTVDILNGGVQVPVFSGTATKAPVYAAPTYLAFPSIMLQGSSFPKKGSQLSFGPPLNCFGEMGWHSTMGHIQRSSQAQLNKFDVQLSEMCQRRFVMFDRCGSKRRMIFHPALINEFPALLPSSLPKTGACNLNPSPDKAFSYIGMPTVASPFLASTAPVGPTFPNHNSNLLLRETFVNPQSSASDNCNTPILLGGENAEAKREQDGDGIELSCYSHENTEDIEALLSSDEDEVSSTGHSPSDLTRNNSPLNSDNNNEGHGVCASSGKRKNTTEINFEDEDTCSTATSGIKMCKEMPCQNVDVAGTDASCGKERFFAPHQATLYRNLGLGNEDFTAFDMFFSDEVSSSSSANNQRWDNKLLFKQQQQQPDGQSRKEKIRSILRLLRGIIPGGESMDTAFVLDEAIQYVKTLQFEVQKLQARKLT